jgi:lysophospholipase L1-like esterase
VPAPGATIAVRLQRIREVATQEPRVVVIALGTNDGFFGSPHPGQDAEEALKVLDRVDCVRWIGVADVKGTPALVNLPIAEAVKRHRNAEFVDWATPAAAHPEWHQEDGVHHTDVGKVAFAAAIADAVRSCGRGG